tara:strand:- start:246 stop:434 length:189 start_codon:yes stop_codon:yes gene_type:complete
MLSVSKTTIAGLSASDSSKRPSTAKPTIKASGKADRAIHSNTVMFGGRLRSSVVGPLRQTAQ